MKRDTRIQLNEIIIYELNLDENRMTLFLITNDFSYDIKKMSTQNWLVVIPNLISISRNIHDNEILLHTRKLIFSNILMFDNVS